MDKVKIYTRTTLIFQDHATLFRMSESQPQSDLKDFLSHK